METLETMLSKLKLSLGAREIGQWLRVCTIPPEDPKNTPSTHIWWLIVACNYSSTKFDTCGLCSYLHSHVDT